ncbi:MAG: tetratricopeptide repeat protein, partial [Acidobacteria bacterium]|nr:tetratricopeptide repeat protein [Acidobacteriota bacterium]
HLLESLEAAEAIYGKESKEYAGALEAYGDLCAYEGDLEKAKKMYEESISVKEKLFGVQSWELGLPLANLSWVFYARDELDKALPLSLKSCEVLNNSKENEAKLSYAMNILAMIYKSKGDFSKAEETYLKTLELLEKISGGESPDMAQIMNNLGVMYKEKKEYEKAKELYLKALAIQEKTIGSDHIDTAVTLNNLGQIETAQKNFRIAEDYFKRGIKILEKEFPEGSLDSAVYYFNLGNMYQEENKYDKARELYLKAHNLFEKYLGSENNRTKLCAQKIKDVSQKKAK